MPRFPSLFQVNTRARLHELGRAAGRPVTLDGWPDADLDAWAAAGFDWVYLLGVWQTGPAARAASLRPRDGGAGYRHCLPDYTDADVSGSPFAIRAYDAHADFGGDAALAHFRDRLRRRGIKLMLDFVPNHTAPDHPWAESRPEFYVPGTDDDLAREPQNYTRAGGRVLAYGRDPFFDGWSDTLQLNYRHAGLRRAMTEELVRVAGRCDGVRCDMAMLVLPSVFRRTWGDRALPADGSEPADDPFWPQALAAARDLHPGFAAMAEVYWDLEWALQQEGFDYTYDKRLYDRLRAGDAGEVRGHLHAEFEYQRRSARFLENHDEPRAAEVFGPEQHRAAATVAFATPGLRFFHDGQFEGRRKHLSMHLGRRADEPVDESLRAFYERLLGVLRRPELRDGDWRLLECGPAWDGNPTHGQFVASWWQHPGGQLLACANYGPHRGQCRVQMPHGWPGRAVRLRDLLGDAAYDRDGGELGERGLFLDLPPWGRHAFAVEVL